MRLARRVGACVLVLLVLGETSGLARAFGPGSTVHCCCGDHASARPCPCPDCPVTIVRAGGAHEREARLMAGRDCHGARLDEPGVLSVVALASRPPALARRTEYSFRDLAHILTLSDRDLDPARPPP